MHFSIAYALTELIFDRSFLGIQYVNQCTSLCKRITYETFTFSEHMMVLFRLVLVLRLNKFVTDDSG